ncbi:MAG: hypothetical protein V1681_08440 [Candidatus Neomarinimicrobiota bacterium]
MKTKINLKRLSEYILAVGLALIVYLCFHRPLTVDFNSIDRKVPIPAKTALTERQFNRQSKARLISIPIGSDTLLTGCRTNNRAFYTLVMQPALKPYLPILSRQSATEIINALTIFCYEMYQEYFGPGFYRWGGDLLDLDDPQAEGTRWEYSFGLDCSGFVTAPYELAVDCGLLKPTAEGAIFSSKGFKLYCQRAGFIDGGGRLGSGNRYRLDTAELAQIGRVVFTLPKNSKPTRRQLRMLQPGDIVGDTGHFGTIIEVNKILYYLESGGRVVPQHDYKPYRADKALASLAETRPIDIRRALPDRRKN